MSGFLMVAAEEWAREDAFEALDELDKRVLLRNAFDLLAQNGWGVPPHRTYTDKEYHRIGMNLVGEELLQVCWERAAWGSQWNTDECQHLVRFHACLKELTVVGKPCIFPAGIPTAGWVGHAFVHSFV